MDGFSLREYLSVTAHALIEQCVARQFRPGWSCSTGNLPSAALGRKLGFAVQEEIHGYPLERSFVLTRGVWGPPAP
jgi:hypothetical protein